MDDDGSVTNPLIAAAAAVLPWWWLAFSGGEGGDRFSIREWPLDLSSMVLIIIIREGIR